MKSYSCRLSEIVKHWLDVSGQGGAAAKRVAPGFADKLDRLLPRNERAHRLTDSKDAQRLSTLELQTELDARPDVQARLANITGYTTSKWLLEQELKARGDWSVEDEQKHKDVYRCAAGLELKGMCLSGGGIRSATFGLGFVQGMAAQGKLGSLDYLATVSGGGYLHQFLASWIDCESLAQVQQQLVPLPQNRERTLQPDPLRWLRRFSNYLTPQIGFFSADTWTAAAIWMRNTFLNQLVLISSLMVVLLLPHALPVIAAQLLTAPWCVYLATPLILGAMIFSGLRLRRFVYESNGTFRKKRAGSVLLWILLPLAFSALAVSLPVYRTIFMGNQPSLATKIALFRLNGPQPNDGTLDTFQGKSVQLVVRGKVVASNSLASRLKANWACRPVSMLSKTMRHACPVPHAPAKLGWWRSLNWKAVVPSAAFLFGVCVWVTCAVFGAVKEPWSLWKKLMIGTVSGVLFGYLLLYLVRTILFGLFFLAPHANTIANFGVVFTPLFVLAVPYVSLELAIGLLGNRIGDPEREWFARLRAWSFIFGLGWLAITGFSLLGPMLVHGIAGLASWRQVSWIGWLGTTIGTVLAGKSAATPATPNAGASGTKATALNLLTKIGPPIAVGGLVLLLSTVIDAMLGTELLAQKPWRDVCLSIALAGFAAFFSWRIDVNDFSMHAFYRDRLARCYAGASNPDRSPNVFTGLATTDTCLRVADLLPEKFTHAGFENYGPERSRQGCPTGKKRYDGPFPIFCATLNLSFGEDLAYQERKAARFSFTPLFSGYEVGWTEAENGKKVEFNGFAPTRSFAYGDSGGVHVATAVAASGAAVSPNWGYHTNPAMAFLLTIFNVRLGCWIHNPRYKEKLSSPRFGLLWLFLELFGMANDERAYVYLSDGGHFENMGLYDLVRRRCTTIIICDGEEDHGLTFSGLAMAIRKCRIDFGAEIDLDLDEVKRINLRSNGTQYSTGSITYPMDDGGGPVMGKVLYVKTSLIGTEPLDLLNYGREHDRFPQESTLDQWFTESQFESYRRLGQFVAEQNAVMQWLTKNL